MASGRKENLAQTDPVADQQSLRISSSTFDEVQREEILDGGNLMALDLSHALPGATLRVSTSSTQAADAPRRSPTANSSKKHANAGTTFQFQEDTISPLQSPGAGPVDSAAVDFQEAVLRGDQRRKSYPTMTRTENSPSPVENAPALRRRSRSDTVEGRQKKIPFNSDRLKARMEQEASAFVRNRKPNLATAMQEKSPDRNKSTRGAKAAVADVQEVGGMPKERRSSRSATRRARAEAQDVLEEGDLGMGDANRASRRRARPQTKPKVPDPITTTTIRFSSLPELRFPPIQTAVVPQVYLPPHRTDPATAPCYSTSPGRASRETSASGSSDWLLFLVDIVMWRHIPRSALLFGVGGFCILSTSLMQDSQFSAISVFAYIALLYLGATFLKFTFLRGASRSAFLSPASPLTESDALKLMKVLLPPANIILSKFADLFSGEPIVTLKVAAALWLLAQAGHVMNLWTLSRITYFALFIIPKVYSSYSDQIHRQARILLHRARCRWDACTHKKAVSFAAFALAWNFFSVSTRIFGAFISVVALCIYQQGRRDGPFENRNFNIPDGNRPIRMHSAPPCGLQLMALPQPTI